MLAVYKINFQAMQINKNSFLKESQTSNTIPFMASSAFDVYLLNV